MHCYLCHHTSIIQREGKVRDNPRIKILECESCGLVFLDSQLNEEYYQNNKMNDREFFKLTGRDDQNLDTQDLLKTLSKDRATQIQWRLNFIKPKIIGKDILDFGSGRAEFLLLAQEWANSVAGVELESQIANIYQYHKIPLFSHIEEVIRGG